MILHAVEAGTGEGEPAVLLHGLFGAAQNFTAIQRRLAAAHRVIAFDLRNHGVSPHDPAMSYSAMAADVLESLAALSVQRAAVIGHSMGGKVVMQAALLHPDRISRLLVADIAPVRYPPAFRDIATAMLTLPLTPGLTRAAADAALSEAVPDPATRGFLLRNLQTGAVPGWRIALSAIAANLPVIDGWDPPADAAYPGPVLVLRGERSSYIQPEHRPAFRALFPACRFATLPGAGHWLHADAPDAFVLIVQEFLDG